MIACRHCGRTFEAKTARREFCSDRCRVAAWHRKRDERETRLRGLIKVLAKEAGVGAEDFA
jgi:predicted nucleic acid-binding Zn ribbon protein